MTDRQNHDDILTVYSGFTRQGDSHDNDLDTILFSIQASFIHLSRQTETGQSEHQTVALGYLVTTTSSVNPDAEMKISTIGLEMTILRERSGWENLISFYHTRRTPNTLQLSWEAGIC